MTASGDAGPPHEESHSDHIGLAMCGRLDDTEDHVIEVDMPALAGALEPFGEILTVAEARSRPELRPLDASQRRGIIDQAMLCLQHVYVHRDLKRTRHAVDPVAALRGLRRRCDEMGPLEFHLEIMRIFKGLRDNHTTYILPQPYSSMIAFLPFLLGAYWREKGTDEVEPGAEPHVIVTGLLTGFEHGHFRKGVEILTWNGVPILTAIRRIGADEQGSNPEAQFELGLRLMTVRWFGGSFPPEEYWVTLRYRDREGTVREIRFTWRVMLDNTTTHVAALLVAQGLQSKFRVGGGRKAPKRQTAERASADPAMERRSFVEKYARRSLFPREPEEEELPQLTRKRIRLPDVSSDVLKAWRIVLDPGGEAYEFGMIRISHFNVEPKAFKADFDKLLGAIPETGLIIDIRSNPGGEVAAAEGILQSLTAKRIEPLPFQFLATDLVEELVMSPKLNATAMLARWRDLVRTSVDTGSQFSRLAHLSDLAAAGDAAQVYVGPVALLTDAVTYSSGDIFAASFKDHGIGIVLGADPNTGGGGANMWSHDSLVNFVRPGGRLDYLPLGVQMHFAVRRCTRLGANLGLPIEEEGVKADEVYYATRDDILRRDVDLLAWAAGFLKQDARAGRGSPQGG